MSRVKELSVTTALQIVELELKQNVELLGKSATSKDLFNEFLETYRSIYKELTAPTDD